MFYKKLGSKKGLDERFHKCSMSQGSSKSDQKDTFLKNLLIQMTFMARLAYINQEKWEEGNFKNAMVVVLWVNFAHCVCGNL